MKRKQQDVDDSGLLAGLDERSARRVRAEARVLDVLLEVHDKMEERGVGTRMLARLLDASAGQVSRWLKAETGIHARTMFLLADALGYDLRIQWERREDTPLVNTTEETFAPVVFELPKRPATHVVIEGPGFGEDGLAA